MTPAVHTKLLANTTPSEYHLLIVIEKLVQANGKAWEAKVKEDSAYSCKQTNMALKGLEDKKLIVRDYDPHSGESYFQINCIAIAMLPDSPYAISPSLSATNFNTPTHFLNNAHHFISLSDYFRVVPHLTPEEQLVVLLLTRVSYLTLTEIDHCTLLPNTESVVMKLLEKGVLIQTPIQKTDDEDELFYKLNVDRIKSLPKYAPLDDVD